MAEHLQPGEAFVAAAARGLEEELGVVVDAQLLQGPLLPRRKRQLDLPDIGVKDYEVCVGVGVGGGGGQRGGPHTAPAH